MPPCIRITFFYDQLFGKEAAVCLSASSLTGRNKVIPLMFAHSSYKEEEGICCMVGKYCCRLSVMKPSPEIGGLHVLFSDQDTACNMQGISLNMETTPQGKLNPALKCVSAEPLWAVQLIGLSRAYQLVCVCVCVCSICLGIKCLKGQRLREPGWDLEFR